MQMSESVETWNEILHFKRYTFDELVERGGYETIKSTLFVLQGKVATMAQSGVVEHSKIKDFEFQIGLIQNRFAQIQETLSILTALQPLGLKTIHKGDLYQQAAMHREQSADDTASCITTSQIDQTIEIHSDTVSNCKNCLISTSPGLPYTKPITIRDCDSCKIRIEHITHYFGSLSMSNITASSIFLSWNPSLKNQIRLTNLQNCHIHIAKKTNGTPSGELFTVVLENCSNCTFNIECRDIVSIKDFNDLLGTGTNYRFS